jgi:prepilin-type N-terminal cleavage/methylation domain-containing protein
MNVITKRSGFTLVETAISMGVFAILLASVFSIAVETSSFLGETDADNAVQMEGNRAFTRLAEILRKSGRIEIAGVTYPRVTNGGSELQFRILTDRDGNGYAFEEGTGKLEWDDRVFTVKCDDDGYLDIYESGNKVYALSRHISGLSFQTIAENNALHLKEILIEFLASKPTPSGATAAFPLKGSIHMRN